MNARFQALFAYVVNVKYMDNGIYLLWVLDYSFPQIIGFHERTI